MTPRRLAVAIAIAGVLAAWGLAGAAAAQPAEPPPPQPIPPVSALTVRPLDNDDGRHLTISFERAEGNTPKAGIATVVLATVADGEAPVPPTLPLGEKLESSVAVQRWTVAGVLEGGEKVLAAEVPSGRRYVIALVEVRRDADGAVVSTSSPVLSAPVAPVASWFHTGRVGYLGMVLLIVGLIGYYIRKARRSPEAIFVRRIPGIDAIEDAVGRSTEMGRPVLYVTGLEEIQDIQTLASLLILGHVAELTATYDTDLEVANYYPMTMVVAEEIVRQGYANVGRIDAHRPEKVMFISAEQFAFAAGVNGLILRDRPATNIYLGKFFGESLLLAETGFLTGAVQIGGTAELTQLPFFVAACDYTLIGEEMYATSAYLSREPTLLANLKAGDGFKLLAMIFIVTGVVLATAGLYQLGPAVFR